MLVMTVLSGCTSEGGVGGPDLAAVVGRKGIEGPAGGLQRSHVGLGAGEETAQISGARSREKASGRSQATKASNLLGVVDPVRERAPSVSGGDHRAPRATQRAGFQVLETARLPVNARAYAYRQDGEVSEILET